MIISLPALTSFLWYPRRTPYFTMPASLSRSDCSMVVLGAAAPTEPPSSSKATQRERSTGRYHFTAMGRASSAFIFSHLLGFGSAEDSSSPELQTSPSNSSALSVLTVVLIAGLVALGETHWLSVHIFPIGLHVCVRVLSASPCPLCISLSDCSCSSLPRTASLSVTVLFYSHIHILSISAGVQIGDVQVLLHWEVLQNQGMKAVRPAMLVPIVVMSMAVTPT